MLASDRSWPIVRGRERDLWVCFLLRCGILLTNAVDVDGTAKLALARRAESRFWLF